MDFAGRGQQAVPPLFISTWSIYSAITDATEMPNGTPAAQAWTANEAMYVPFKLPWPYPVRRAFWINGSTTTGNADIGVYTADGERLWSAGSTGQTGALTGQYVTPSTPLLLQPGTYFWAVAFSGTSGVVHGQTVTNSRRLQIAGLLQQSSAFPLPSVMTPAAFSRTVVPLFGFTKHASI